MEIIVSLWRFERAFPEIPPALPFLKGRRAFGEFMLEDSIFSPLEKGEEGGFSGFSKG